MRQFLLITFRDVEVVRQKGKAYYLVDYCRLHSHTSWMLCLCCRL